LFAEYIDTSSLVFALCADNHEPPSWKEKRQRLTDPFSGDRRHCPIWDC
jgi:hypothetical protein